MSEINPAYFVRDNTEQCAELFQSQGSITLQLFFNEDYYTKLQEELERMPFNLAKHPIEYRYEKGMLPQSLTTLFASEKFALLIKVITGDGCHGVKGDAYRFTWKDYTILDDRASDEPGIDVIIDCNDEWDQELGGSVVYVNGTGDYSVIAPGRNTMTLVKRDKKDRKFIRYINHHAKGKARVVIMGTLMRTNK